MRFLKRLFTVLSTMALGIILALVLMEIGLRVFFPQVYPTTPAHDVLFLEPDRVVGWIHPKNFDFLWNGRNPYCIEFSENISMNNYGFRDVNDWSIEKPKDTIRIAMIGDSFIEALQVPDARTASKLLETQLTQAYPDQKFQVMNFGTSNYGVGQYLMVYEEYVKQFQPDYVVIFASYLHYRRTTDRILESTLQSFYALNIRPSYEIGTDGKLVYLPATQYDEFVSAVNKLIETRFGEDRSAELIPDDSPFYTVTLAFNLLSHSTHRPGVDPRDANQNFPDVPLNERIIEELNREIQTDGGSLLFVDAFDYLERYGKPSGSGSLVAHNQAFIESIRAGYVDVSPAFRASSLNPQYECDVHLNTTGNQILADTMTTWMQDHAGL